MDLKDQLKNLFPDHPDPEDGKQVPNPEEGLWIQEAPILCKFEKRRGKAVTILEGYTGADRDFKRLCGDLKRELGVGGSWKNDLIIIQGDYRDRIMEILKELGFRVKRVGG
ncbi:MAG: translation initiation factor [Robiginitalea sp.]|nr:translation initiation factor [Robiginitalea sp.]